MLDALAKGVLEVTKQEHKKKGRIEGRAEEGWLVLDYGDVVVHLFSPDMREYYDLEELWSDGKILLRMKIPFHFFLRGKRKLPQAVRPRSKRWAPG